MIVDSHIHLYPPHVSLDPAAWARERNETYWLSCVAPQQGTSLQAWKSVSELLRDMDAAKVEKAVVLAWYWQNHDTCKENLDWQLRWIRDYPDRLLAFAPFNPKGGQASLDLLKLAFEAGCKGIGELNPPAQGYPYEDPTLSAALDLAASYGGAVNFHLTDPATHDYPGKIETPYLELLSLAKQHPKTQFIFAHLGGCGALRQSSPPPANVYFDTAACPLLYKTPVYRDFCDQVGSDRILFGTDYPLRVFPRDPNSPDFETPLSELRRSGLDAKQLHHLTSANAARLFNLS